MCVSLSRRAEGLLGGLNHIHHVVAQLLALADEVHVIDAYLVTIEAIVDVLQVLVLQLVAVIVDFVLDIVLHVIVGILVLGGFLHHVHHRVERVRYE